MTAPPNPSPPGDPAPQPPDRAAARRQRIDQLTAKGMAFAHAVCDTGIAHANSLQQADTWDPAAKAKTIASLATAYERVARAVRYNTLLDEHLDRPAPARTPARTRTAARRHIIRKVENAIRSDDRLGPAAKQRLEIELLERLDGPDIEEDLLDGPLDTIIEDLCRDLGLGLLGGMPSARRTPADIALLNARAAAPAIKAQPPDPAPPDRPLPDRPLPDAQIVAQIVRLDRDRPDRDRSGRESLSQIKLDLYRPDHSQADKGLVPATDTG